MSNCYDLCAILISEGIGINAVNSDGHSPLSLHMKGENGAALILRPTDAHTFVQHLFTLLAKNGADMNFRYPEDSFGDKNYKCSIMTNMVRRNSLEMDKLRSNL